MTNVFIECYHKRFRCSSLTYTAISDKHLQECVGQQEIWNTKTVLELFTKHMVEIGLVQLTGACQLPVNDKLMSPLSFSLSAQKGLTQMYITVV